MDAQNLKELCEALSPGLVKVLFFLGFIGKFFFWDSDSEIWKGQSENKSYWPEILFWCRKEKSSLLFIYFIFDKSWVIPSIISIIWIHFIKSLFFCQKNNCFIFIYNKFWWIYTSISDYQTVDSKIMNQFGRLIHSQVFSYQRNILISYSFHLIIEFRIKIALSFFIIHW